MLKVPYLEAAERQIVTNSIDETVNPLLDLDDARALVERNLRPTHVVVRNRPRTEQIAERVYEERRWAGIQWWSSYLPQWTVTALWSATSSPSPRSSRSLAIAPSTTRPVH